jgi:3-phosphoshikimate 1-carboxyvinyltransferase
MEFVLPIASAQVKSCLLLAGLGIEGITKITEPEKTRDHTERMLQSMGADLVIDGLQITLTGGRPLHPFSLTVPSDFSSAAFFITAALITPHAEVIIHSVGVNPTRTGFLDILTDMGAKVSVENMQIVSGEPVADLVCSTAPGLRAVTLGKREVARAIDEFPLLCVLASQAEGTTIIHGAQELRLKESDRIAAMAAGLKRMGVTVETFEDGIAITGKAALRAAEIDSYQDHRIAMAFAIAGLIAEGQTIIRQASCADISFPGFYELLERLKQ